MKLLLLGATGRTGSELLTQACAQGHEVTALVRDPDKLRSQSRRLRVLVGSATDAAAIANAVQGQDAVLCALGPTSALQLMRCNLMRSAVPLLLRAMEPAGVRRLVLLSALGAGESARYAPMPLRLMFRTALRQVGTDKADAEMTIRASSLDWTLVYPPSLTTGPAIGGYRHGEELRLTGMPKLSRADLAAFMLSQLADSRYLRKQVIVSC